MHMTFGQGGDVNDEEDDGPINMVSAELTYHMYGEQDQC